MTEDPGGLRSDAQTPDGNKHTEAVSSGAADGVSMTRVAEGDRHAGVLLTLYWYAARPLSQATRSGKPSIQTRHTRISRSGCSPTVVGDRSMQATIAKCYNTNRANARPWSIFCRNEREFQLHTVHGHEVSTQSNSIAVNRRPFPRMLVCILTRLDVLTAHPILGCLGRGFLGVPLDGACMVLHSAF